MNTAIHSFITKIGIFIILISLSLSLIAEEKPDKSHPWGKTIMSLLVRNDKILASTMNGIFYASPTEQKWNKLNTPSIMPHGGQLIGCPKIKDVILYLALFPDKRKESVYGLYISKDGGATWDKIKYKYPPQRNVLLHSNGNIYAVVSEPIEDEEYKYTKQHIVFSSDLGKTWQDITGDAACGGGVWRLFENKSGKICTQTQTSIGRFSIFYSDPKDHIWERMDGQSWINKNQPENEFFAVSSNLSRHATLDNYFDFKFGNSIILPLVDLHPLQNEYIFHRDNGKKSVEIELKVLSDDLKAKVADVPNYVFWNTRFISPDGKRLHSYNFQKGKFNPKAIKRNKLLQKKFHDNPLQFSVDIDKDNPFKKNLYLTDFGDFSKVGLYKVQFCYAISWNLFDKKHKWIKSCYSKPINIKIIDKDDNNREHGD